MQVLSDRKVQIMSWRPAVVSGNTQFQIKVNLVVCDEIIDINTWGKILI